MYLRAFLVMVCLLAGSAASSAADIEGIRIADRVDLQPENVTLQLNGAGVRHKMAIVKVYVGALYLVTKSPDAAAIIEDPSAKRLSMHIVADQVTAQDLISSMNNALAANHIPAELALVESRIRELNRTMQAVGSLMKGAVITLDYLPGTGTRVSINGEPKITISGRDFHQAMLRVWLGSRPVDGRLKDAMLGSPGGFSLFK
jgi:hypothetical protein